MPGPFYTASDDEIYVSRLIHVAPYEVRMVINPLSGGKTVFLDPVTAEAIGTRLIELAREAKSAEAFLRLYDGDGSETGEDE